MSDSASSLGNSEANLESILHSKWVSAIFVAVLIVAGLVTWRIYHPSIEGKYKLEDVLWVTDRPVKNFYPPRSSRSLEMFHRLKKAKTTPNFDGYVLIRDGLTKDDYGEEAVLVFPTLELLMEYIHQHQGTIHR